MTFGKTFGLAVTLMAALSASDHVLAQDTLSLDEVKTAAAAKFDKLDRNGDASIDADEGKELLGDRGFKAADSDDDGSLDRKDAGRETLQARGRRP